MRKPKLGEKQGISYSTTYAIQAKIVLLKLSNSFVLENYDNDRARRSIILNSS